MVGNAVWFAVTIIFGRLIGNVFDFRVLIQAVVTLVLLALSLRMAAKQGKSSLTV